MKDIPQHRTYLARIEELEMENEELKKKENVKLDEIIELLKDMHDLILSSNYE
jgi:hypothetical protein